MKNNLQIIKQLQNKFGWFYYKLKSNEVTHLKLNYKGVETKDLELIGELTSLEELELYNNKIDTIQGLDKLTKLEELQLAFNQISKIKGLDKLTKLRGLHLGWNKITKIEGLSNLTSLEKLYLHYNQITEKEIDKFKATNKKIKVYA